MGEKTLNLEEIDVEMTKKGNLKKSLMWGKFRNLSLAKESWNPKARW